MNFTQIRNEVVKDIPYVYRKVANLFTKFIRNCEKYKLSYGYNKYLDYKSPNGNKYTIRLKYESVKTSFNFWTSLKNDISKLTIFIPTSPSGNYTDTTATILTQHFFKRYSERMNLSEMSFENLQKHFFESTDFRGIIETYNADYIDDKETVLQVKCVYENGIGLGFLNQNDNFLIMNTFISEKEFKGSNWNTFNKGKIALDDYKKAISLVYELAA